MSEMRLDRLLSNMGYGSRKDIALMVKTGRVLFNGAALKQADQRVKLADAAMFTIDDEPLDPLAPLTVMLHKPRGYTCSHDELGLLVYDLLPKRWHLRKPALSTAGRLDKDSTGQVILTDDGELLHRIIHPKHHAAKHYSVTLEKPLSGHETMLFGAGDFLMKGDTKPLKAANWMQETELTGRMTLFEGRFHQIRRMFETLGNQVVELHRVQTGGLRLEGLEEGQYRVLSKAEVDRIFKAAV